MKHKNACAVFLLVLLILLIASPFVAIHVPNNQVAESCFSIIFDKWAMNTVNKVIIQTPEQQIAVDDKILIDGIVKETMVAECGGVKAMYGEYSLFLYNDKGLVRTVKLSSTDKQYAIVYEADGKHWVAGYDSGTAILSDELILQIEQFLQKTVMLGAGLRIRASSRTVAAVGVAALSITPIPSNNNKTGDTSLRSASCFYAILYHLTS